MDKHEAQVARAEEAQQLLNNPMFAQAFNDTRTAVMEAWASLSTDQKETQLELLLMIKCLDKVRKVVEGHVSTGRIAQKEIEGRKRFFSRGA